MILNEISFYACVVHLSLICVFFDRGQVIETSSFFVRGQVIETSSFVCCAQMTVILTDVSTYVNAYVSLYHVSSYVYYLSSNLIQIYFYVFPLSLFDHLKVYLKQKLSFVLLSSIIIP